MEQFRRRLRTLIYFAAFAGSWAGAQQSNRITGHVADSATGEPVEYAQILNFSLQKQMYSNQKGQFSLEARPGDTLVVYGLGYYYYKMTVTESMLQDEPVSILLIHEPYSLSAAQILGIGNYSDFRNKLINEEPPKTKTEQLNESMESPILRAALEGFQEYMVSHPSIASIPIRTPEEIERLKLDKIKNKERISNMVYHKFNPLIVKEITGLSDDSEIIEFMLYCNFSESYILEANSYDLAERIAAKYELFRKKKEDEKLKNDPLNFIEELLQPFA
ncbi:MAG TPA: carboxypeptidase-like regulatory domain-containing protein [Bacteroidales bacterium]|jgi:hypothetical protein|nr:carboxypeptidase-like regulatory domain-containing protein [Bacteroidales bacterium]